VNEGIVELSYCNSQNQIADIMTKPIKLEQFEKLRGMTLREGMLDIIVFK